ncbi:hypothetical protein ASF53_11000 [Methylobacterium sp. Leaf123]|uniref:BrnA antitoxin family protein n=1 Tax=Methylobacterium sp. Leaf123 TaxID=1736264 RepID=UPI0006FBDB27|nr:BrnA antitoxin family protein [Methylobacterium sp. Leaf123]KQQ14330.1 hypothetical protein ASF53_11000 [Methylobacterium sp. Leaf123]
MAIDRTRRPSDPRQAAEAAFRAVTTRKAPDEAAPAPPKAPLIPGTRETVSLRIDRAVLEHYQKDGPGWQDRINAALKAAAGL